MAVDALLVLLQHLLTGTLSWHESRPAALAAESWSAGLQVLEAGTAWWLYHRAAQGSRCLNDPRSATLFLFLIPGLTTGIFALLRALPYWFLGPSETGLLHWIFLFWISTALGLMAVAPLLLVTATGWMVRRGLALEEPPQGPQQLGGLVPGRVLRGDWIELGGLTAGAGLLGLLLARGQSVLGGSDWQLWGVLFLVIVWATVRQSMRGGLIAAGAAAAAPLTWIALWGGTERQDALLQMNLLAQCSATLLVTASANWIRGSEARYRRVVGHIPVVLYSARVVQPGSRGRPLAAEITFVSPVSAEVLGCAPGDLLGSYDRWLERVHPDDREIVLAAVAQLGRQTEPVTCEYRLISITRLAQASASSTGFLLPNSRVIPLQSSGTPECWLRDTLAPVFGADGVLEGWDGVVIDITQQRALANDLRQTTSMFYALVANLPAGVFFVQAPSGRPILVNARARQLLGQREDPSVGLDHLVEAYRLHRPDGTPYPTEELPVTLAIRHGLTTMRDDIVVHRPDGKRLPLVTWAAPIDRRGQGQNQAAVWVFEDLMALHPTKPAHRESEAVSPA